MSNDNEVRLINHPESLQGIKNACSVQNRIEALVDDECSSRVITCDAYGRDVETLVTDLESNLKQLQLPQGIHIEVTGEHLAKQKAQSELLYSGIAAMLAIIVLLWMALRSYMATLLVLINVPFALIGGVLSVYWMGSVLNVGSLVGFVTLFGITMRNGIMMVTHWQHLATEKPDLDRISLILLGARERLGPILMTALVTVLGLMPIALGSQQAGREIEGPMAIVILGGLGTSTLLNLFVLPSIVSLVSAFRMRGKLAL